MMRSSFKPSSLRQRFIARCMLLVLLMQVWIPIGYMPASLATDGSLVRLCPNGMSDDLMMVLHPGHELHVDHVTQNHSAHEHAAHHQSTRDRSLHDNALHHIHHDRAQGDHSKHDIVIEHHGTDSSSWHNQCPYGSSAPSSALVSTGADLNGEIIPRQLRIALLPALYLLAEKFRQQSPRAPPKSIS